MAIQTRVIDVSEHQGLIDWERVKPQIDGAIIRAGYGMDLENQDDQYFKRNADECTRLGIPFGVYLYSYADSTDKIKSEANHVLRLVKGYRLSYPIYLDLEEDSTRNGAVERAGVFGDIIEAAGYHCGIYANLNWWTNYLKGLERFTKWVAQYYKENQYSGKNLDIWQYTDKGKVEGIQGNVDLNHCYRDFPSEINNTPSETNNTPSDNSENTVSVTVPVLQYGSTGVYVQSIQLLLIGKGYPCGSWGADGTWGKATEAAVIKFQQALGLDADGIIGIQTWVKLLSS